MKELISIYNLVKEILTADVTARNSDVYLIEKVDERLYPGITEMPYGFVLENRKLFGLPSFETIRRSRQKVQHDYPKLQADKDVKGERAKLEAEYFDFALSEI